MRRGLEMNDVEHELIEAAFEQLARAERIMEQAANMRYNAVQHIADVAKERFPDLTAGGFRIHFNRVKREYEIETEDKPTPKKRRGK